MARKLFTVDDVFSIRDRGTIIVPGVVPEGDEKFRIGDQLRLVRPDGSEVATTIDGIAFFNPDPQRRYAVIVPLPKPEIPVGTEVWSL